MNINKLTQLVNKYDPADLIKNGCPDDEYAPEVGDIFYALQERTMDETELEKLIKSIFVKWFDETTVINSESDVYKNLAHEILAEMK